MGIFSFLKNKGSEAANAAGQKAVRLENGDLVEAVVFGSVIWLTLTVNWKIQNWKTCRNSWKVTTSSPASLRQNWAR